MYPNFRYLSGAFTVNGVAVSKQLTLSDGTEIYITKELLYGQEPTIREAFKKLMAETPARCFHGECGEPEQLKRPTN